MKYVINDGQGGYLYKNGQSVKVLDSGKHNYSKAFGYMVHIVSAIGKVDTFGIPMKKLMEVDFFLKNTVTEPLPYGGIGYIVTEGDSCLTRHHDRLRRP